MTAGNKGSHMTAKPMPISRAYIRFYVRRLRLTKSGAVVTNIPVSDEAICAGAYGYVRRGVHGTPYVAEVFPALPDGMHVYRATSWRPVGAHPMTAITYDCIARSRADALAMVQRAYPNARFEYKSHTLVAEAIAPNSGAVNTATATRGHT